VHWDLATLLAQLGLTGDAVRTAAPEAVPEGPQSWW